MSLLIGVGIVGICYFILDNISMNVFEMLRGFFFVFLILMVRC